MGRAPCCDKTKVKRGPWSPDEDTTLKAYVHKYGTGGNWISLPQKAGLKRCGKSCRLRWLNYLRPDIRHGGFTEEEDQIILSLYNNIGSRWSVIASHLPGRTDNDVKNYWNTKLKKKLLAATAAATSPAATASSNPFTRTVPMGFDPTNYYGTEPSSVPEVAVVGSQFPVPGPNIEEVEEKCTKNNANFTTSLSNQEIPLFSYGDNSCWVGINNGGIEEDELFLMDHIMNNYGFDFQEKFGAAAANCSTNPPSSKGFGY
ncbi:hypothetical protein DM860_004078 [Cuscuta australis]|uniref:Uncharacterized protein n=1 Tax=Cuscuta australis TaxID=267555 RepID=A0A328CVY7_9ASTE|nr:hypothetical protein DM860_004078 [Cuscuta australis]